MDASTTTSRPVPGWLADWITTQRWFGGKGRTPQFSEIGRWILATGEDGVAAEVALILDSAAGEGTLYQVPLTTRRIAIDGLDALATTSDGTVYDGAHDPAFAAALLELASQGGDASGPGVDVTGVPASAGVIRASASKVLSGEQSNTSIIIDTVDVSRVASTPVIIKLFRALHPGQNPDVELQTAIAGAGSTAVPRSIGSVEGVWDGRMGHLAFAQEFLPGTEDAWRVATAAVNSGTPFDTEARELGAATAEVHEILARVLPTASPSRTRVAGVIDSMAARASDAIAAVPELAPLRSAIDAVYAAALLEPWPEFQRIHGDYHLGQVLHAPGRGWVLLDFEGEPLRPMTERSVPDLALRDVAGMLRSFDYAAGASEQLSGDPAQAQIAREWAASARVAFLAGYEERAGVELRENAQLLAALELDKALYEAVYEARNRPSWLPIPTAAIIRLVSLDG